MTDVDVVLAALAEERASVDPTVSWKLRPATVMTAGTVGVMIRFDGEGFDGGASVDVPATSLIGYLASGARAMALSVPPLGVYVVADISGATIEYATTDTLDTTTSTTYVSTDVNVVLVGLTFVVPASGKTKIMWGGSVNNSTSSFSIISPQIAEGSTIDAGDVVVSPADTNDARVDGTNLVRTTNFYVFNAADYFITPGSVMNVALYQRVGGGTGLFAFRRVAAVPVK